MGIVIALAVVGFAVVIGLAVLSNAANQKRATALRDWALQRDYSYTESDHSLGRLYQSLPYERGSRVEFDNVIRGRLGGRPLTIFDYSYRTTETHQSPSATGMGSTGMGGTSTSTSTHRLKVVSIDLPRRRPEITVAASGFFSKIAVTFGGQDVEIGDPAFDRAFRVRTEDQNSARELLGPLAGVLLHYPDQVLHVRDDVLLVYRDGTHTPEDLDGWLTALKAGLALALPPSETG